MTREKAIKVLKENYDYHVNYDCGDYCAWGYELAEAVKMTIKALEQEPKMGHWIALGNYDDWGNESSYKCSECGEIDTYPDNYCPNCGAKMVKSQESEDK